MGFGPRSGTLRIMDSKMHEADSVSLIRSFARFVSSLRLLAFDRSHSSLVTVFFTFRFTHPLRCSSSHRSPAHPFAFKLKLVGKVVYVYELKAAIS